MARDGMTTFSDIAGRLELLRVECAKCGRSGQYRVMRLMKELGSDVTLHEFKLKITADCQRQQAKSMSDPCRAVFPDLATLG